MIEEGPTYALHCALILETKGGAATGVGTWYGAYSMSAEEIKNKHRPLFKRKHKVEQERRAP